MKKKRIIGALLAAAIAVTATASGCSLVSSNTAADLGQVIATVNLSDVKGLEGDDKELVDNYKTAVGTSVITKRELVSAYLNVGYSYTQSGTSSSDVFEMLVDGLTENAVLTQYATMYLLREKAKTDAGALKQFTDPEKTDVQKYEYLLGGEDSDDVKLAKYSLYSTLNAAIDTYEQAIIDDSHTHSAATDTRTTPANVDTEKEDYYPKTSEGKLDYNVYTGYAGYQLSDSGAYKDDAIEGTSKATRIRAYGQFMSAIINNDLVDPEEEDLRKVLDLGYIGDEYLSRLETRVINKYYDLYEEGQEQILTDGGTYGYLDEVYNDLVNLQTESNAQTSSFSTAMDNMSDTSFVLYSPNTDGEGIFGYVYNILLPFSASQSARLTELQVGSNYKDEDGNYTPAYYTARNELMKEITTVDQRAAWFNGATVYAFDAEESGLSDYYKGEGGRNWLFFENNLTKTDRYEPLARYDGRYSYNGAVHKNENDYTLVPNKLDIDGMLEEFVHYVNYVLGDSKASYIKTSGYYKTYDSSNLYSDVDEKEIDYQNFIYADGKVAFTYHAGVNAEQYNRTYLRNRDSEQYKALSAVNELQYAYTTDTAVLSEYLGYNVTLGDTTGYIKEFEYAAHKAIEGGAGTFNVCAGDYGWHILYVPYTFGTNHNGTGSSQGGEEYTPDWVNNVDKEGTFENLFFEWVKSNDISEVSTTRRSKIITQYKDGSVKTYQERYQDLLDLDND